MIETCNCYECLRKFKYDENDTISDFCGIVGKNKDKLIYNSKDCPFFCDRFYDYELKKVITKHEEVYYISDKIDESWDKHSNGLSKGLFVGTSIKGNELQEKRNEWEDKHEGADTVVCPYCDYEYDSYDNPYDEGEEELQCPDCGKQFNCSTNISYSWTTSKLEEDDD
jgi:hypothetical protein